MRVFVTGATGFVGSAVVQELRANGYAVTGLARTADAARKLAGQGVQPLRGTLQNLDLVRAAAAQADGVIHLAFMHNPSKAPFGSLLKIMLGGAPSGIIGRFMAATAATERDALRTIGSALANSGKPFVTTFATMGLASPGTRAVVASEDSTAAALSPGIDRARLEDEVEKIASRGVRASIVRLAPSVHGLGDKGLVPEIIKLARKHKQSVYIGDGSNRWPAVNVRDAAVLFRLALEYGVAGARYHAVAEEGISFRTIAEIVAARLDLPVASMTMGAASKHFGWLSAFAASDNPCSSEQTRQQLGWQSTGPTLLEDLQRPEYFKS